MIRLRGKRCARSLIEGVSLRSSNPVPSSESRTIEREPSGKNMRFGSSLGTIKSSGVRAGLATRSRKPLRPESPSMSVSELFFASTSTIRTLSPAFCAMLPPKFRDVKLFPSPGRALVTITTFGEASGPSTNWPSSFSCNARKTRPITILYSSVVRVRLALATMRPARSNAAIPTGGCVDPALSSATLEPRVPSVLPGPPPIEAGRGIAKDETGTGNAPAPVSVGGYGCCVVTAPVL